MVGGRGSLGRAQEMRELKRRERAMAIEDVTKYYGQQRFTDASTVSWKKDEIKRRERETRERQMEHETLQKLLQDHAEKKLAEQKSMEEGQIANALAQQCNEQQRKFREIQAVREQSEELRELAEKIRTARVNKERFLQMKEREILTKKEENFHAQFDKLMEKERCAAIEKEKQYETKKRNDNVESRRILEEQIQEKEEARINAQLEYDREKELIDEVVRRIQEEDELEAKIKLAKQEETRAYILNFLKLREQQRQEKIENEKKEDQRIAQYLESVHERESAENLRKQALQDEADRIYTKLCQEKEEKARQIEEENMLLDMLREEEAEQKRRLESSERLRKAELARQETIRQNEQQVKLKAEREAARKSEESQFRTKMLEKFAEDDRIDQLNAQRRRQKQIQHRHEVERLIAEKRAMYEALVQKEAEDEAARQLEDERKTSLVESERKRLLEQAADLQEFLPKGVLRDEDDKQYIANLSDFSSQLNVK